MSDKYVSPLVERFATAEMAALFSAQKKFSTWRRCWIALAEAEQELGLPITNEQLAEMRAHVDDIDFKAPDMCRLREGIWRAGSAKILTNSSHRFTTKSAKSKFSTRMYRPTGIIAGWYA
jgi:hypothetical protein